MKLFDGFIINMPFRQFVSLMSLWRNGAEFTVRLRCGSFTTSWIHYGKQVIESVSKSSAWVGERKISDIAWILIATATGGVKFLGSSRKFSRNAFISGKILSDGISCYWSFSTLLDDNSSAEWAVSGGHVCVRCYHRRFQISRRIFKDNFCFLGEMYSVRDNFWWIKRNWVKI